MTDQPLLIFVAVPRTGSTSFTKLCQRNWPDYQKGFNKYKQVIWLKGGHRMKEPDAPSDWRLKGTAMKDFLFEIKQESKLKLVMGHFGYGIHKHFDQSTQYVTILRDPVERVISLYNMFKSLNHNNPVYCHLDGEYDFDLERMIREREFRFVNDQCRMITGGSEDPDEAIEKLRLEYLYTTTENLDSFGATLRDVYGYDLQDDDMPHINQGGHRRIGMDKQIYDEVKALIEQYNAADRKLYEYAKENGPRWDTRNSATPQVDAITPAPQPISTPMSELIKQLSQEDKEQLIAALKE